jgi:WD40 repeat protein/serine/threonine protein kinase
MEDRSGQIIKGYELGERIGAGGFGAVYRARQSSVGREVAIKIILPGFANKPDFIRRFENEAQVVARLEHPHIVPLHDYWRDPTGAYIVMRYLRQGSLKDALLENPFDTESTARLLDQVASALALAHRNEVIHRDLKPGNILLDEDGNAYLADFGIAKVLGDLESNLTKSGVIGSLDYISPEQARSDPVSPQTDIYSLGVVLYEMLTGQHPFPNTSSVERLYNHLNDLLPEITQLGSNGKQVEINAVIQKATAKNPANRFQDVLEMAVAFRKATGAAAPLVGEGIVEILTLREQEVLHGIINGLSNREIANQLVVTLSTVKWYVNQIYRKLGVRSRVQAIVRARELDLVIAPSDSDELPRGRVGTAISVSLPEPENPYRGLRPFQSVDHRYFFGRKKLIDKLIRRMDERDPEIPNRFLAVVGPSGSGKSSVVKAGLIPALWRGDLPGSERWFVVEMLPGAHPLEELEIALLRVAADQATNLRDQLERDARGLLRVAQLILPKDDSELVVVVDQFEEVFTLLEDEAARVHFLNLLYTAVTDQRSRVRVVVTLRADFYDRPLHYPDFGELMRSRMETVLPLSADELERAIRRPAELVGVTFEEGLVPVIIEEVHYQPGALPLLQYALTELFDNRQGRLLTQDAYNEMGGTIGALAKRADDVYENLSPDGQSLARQMFLRLVTLGEGVEDTRRRVARGELIAIADDLDLMDEIIDTYTSYRLLSLDNDPGTRTPIVEVAHEAILREWERLHDWLDESRTDIRDQRTLARVAAEWLNAEHDPSFLIRGARLDHFGTWADKTDLALTRDEGAYLEASLDAQRQREQNEAERHARETVLKQRSRRFLQALVGVFAVATIIAVSLSIFAFNAQKTAQNEAQQRATAQAIAEEERAIAFARELAFASANNLEIDPERSVLLALEAINTMQIIETTNALHQALPALHILHTILVQLPVPGIAFSPDGTRLAYISVDGTTVIVDTTTYQQLLSLPSEMGEGGNDVTFSPDGKHLAAILASQVIVWDAASGDMLFSLPGNSSGHLSFRPGSMGSTQLAVADLNGVPQVWDLSTQTITYALSGHLAPCEGIAYSPDGKLLATGDLAGFIKIWDAETGDELLTFEQGGGIHGMDFSPDSAYLAVASNTGVIWNATTGEALLNLPARSGLYDVAFMLDGQRLVSTHQDGTTIVWDAVTGQQEVVLAGHVSTVISVAASPDNQRVATSGYDGTVKIWDTTQGREVSTLAAHSDEIWSVAYSPDQTRMATVSLDGIAKIWDAASGQLIHSMTPDSYAGGLTGLAFSPDGSTLATGSWSGMVHIWDIDTGQVVMTLTSHTDNAPGLAFSRDGSRLATASWDGTAVMWDISSGRKVETTPKVGTDLWDVPFSLDGEHIYTDCEGGVVCEWDVNSGELLRTFPGPGQEVYGISLSGDGNLLALGWENGFITLWDLASGTELHKISGHAGIVFHLAFNEGDTRLASASLDGFAKVWDVQTGQEIATLYSATSNVWGVAWHGDHLTTSDGDGMLRTYTLDLEELIDLAHSRLSRSLTEEECQKYLHLETCLRK